LLAATNIARMNGIHSAGLAFSGSARPNSWASMSRRCPDQAPGHAQAGEETACRRSLTGRFCSFNCSMTPSLA
jgi:hypothetical protein